MHGICFVEIPTTDLKKTRQFYEQVFGWDVETDPHLNYTTFRPEEGPAGGFREVDTVPAHVGVLLYIEVGEIEEALDRIAQHGGDIVQEKEKVGDRGWEARFTDPSGVEMAIWQTTGKYLEKE